METIVKITWDEPKQQDWLCADNISLALHAYCKNTKFKVEEVSIPMSELVDTGIEMPTDEEIEVWAKSKWNIMENSSYNDAEIRGRIEGAKAIRDGKIIKRNNSL